MGTIVKLSQNSSKFESKVLKIPVYKTKIALSLEEGLIIVSTKDIVSCRAKSNYTLITLKDKTEYMVSKTLKRFQEVFNPNEFIRIHQSHIVAIQSISRVDHQITLSNGQEVPVARSQRPVLLALIEKLAARV